MDTFPDQFLFEITVTEDSQNYVEFKESIFHYSYYYNPYDFNAVFKKFKPTKTRISKLYSLLEKYDVWNWESNYYVPDDNRYSLDAWELIVSWNGKKIHSKGFRHWPDKFDEFCAEMSKIIGEFFSRDRKKSY